MPDKITRRVTLDLVALSAMLAEARRHVGYREGPNNSNQFGRAYGWNNVAWCMQFCFIVAKWSGNTVAVPRTASVAVAVAWFKARGRFGRQPRKGALVCFYSRGKWVHVELVTKVSARWIHTIGGNTNDNGSANGDGVYAKRIPRNSPRIGGYCYPSYPGAAPRRAGKPPRRRPRSRRPAAGPRYGGRVLVYRRGQPMIRGADVETWQRRMNELGYGLAADGVYGRRSVAAARRLQKRAGLPVDGAVGPDTWKATWR